MSMPQEITGTQSQATTGSSATPAITLIIMISAISNGKANSLTHTHTHRLTLAHTLARLERP